MKAYLSMYGQSPKIWDYRKTMLRDHGVCVLDLALLRREYKPIKPPDTMDYWPPIEDLKSVDLPTIMFYNNNTLNVLRS